MQEWEKNEGGRKGQFESNVNSNGCDFIDNNWVLYSLHLHE